MAINIQEILHPSDSDSIKFSKINYNFDQLVVNGGGPAGPKGEIGNTGSTGLTGQQGVTGDKGSKGDSGETTSPWKNIAIDLNLSDGKNNVRILKPKPGTDLESPIIWLGDSSFLDEGSNASDGDTTLRSTLNVGRHYDFGGSAVNAEYATFWHNANAKIKLDSEGVTDGSNNYTRFNLSAVEPIVSGSNPEDIRFSINLPTTHTGEFRLNNFNITGNFEDGMLRYNSGANKFEGYINNAWVELCTAPCGTGGSSGSISISGTNLNLNVDGSEVGGNPTYQYSDWNGSVSVDAAGVVTIANGNATTVVTDPVGPVAANNTAGTNSVAFSVTITVPTGYDNVGQTVAGAYTATQPTSFTATETFTLNLNEGNSGSNWDVTSASLITSNSNGATQNSFNPTSGGGVLQIEANAGTQIQIELLGAVASNLEFVTDPFTITSSGGLTNSIVSQQLSNNDEEAQLILNITLPGSGGTSNFTIEAGTQSSLVAFDCNTTGLVAEVDNGVIGGNVTWTLTLNGVAITPASVTPVTYSAGANNYTLGFNIPSGYTNSGQSTTCTDSALGSTAPTYTTTWNLTDNFTGAILSENMNGTNPVTSITSQPDVSGTTQSAYLFVNKESGYQAFANTSEVTATSSGGTVSGATLGPQGSWVRLLLQDVNQGQNATINVDVSGSLSTEVMTFTWLIPGTSSAQRYMKWSDQAANTDNIQEFTWQDVNSGVQGPPLTPGTAAASDFNWFNWIELDSPNSYVYISDDLNGAINENGIHTGGAGFAKFVFTNDGTNTAGQQNGNNNGTEVIFDGSTWGGTLAPGSVTGMWVVLEPACHLAGTVMQLADGSTKLIEDLEVGDVLKSYSITGLGADEEGTDQWQTYFEDVSQWSAVESTTTVTHVNEGSYNRYINFNNGLTKVTHEHPVLVKSSNDISFKQAGDIVEGDSFYINGAWTEVANIEIVTPEVDFATYTIGVEDLDIYVADGIVWHNGPTVGK